MTSELLMFYNVENFFPPDLQNFQKSTSGLYNWTPYKYKLKLKKINQVFNFVNEDFGQLPSIIGLAEIGAYSVLEDLKNEDSPINNYDIIYEKSEDIRGLSVAMLYDKSRLELVNYQVLRFNYDGSDNGKTRDILQTEFISDGKKLHVFVLHLPSKRLQDAKKNYRNHIITEFKKILSDLYKKDESVIIMGDFNEDPDEENIKQLLFNQDQKTLCNPFETLFSANQYTSFHGKIGVTFDQILFTKDLLQPHFKTINAEIYDNVRLRNKDSKNHKYPLRTYSGSRYIGGYSDHFPVILELEN